MLRQHCKLLLLIFTATAVQQLQVPAAATAVDAARLQPQKVSYSRKLLQPYVLNKTNGDDLVPRSLSGKTSERRVNQATQNVVAPATPAFSLLDRGYLGGNDAAAHSAANAVAVVIWDHACMSLAYGSTVVWDLRHCAVAHRAVSDSRQLALLFM